MININDLASWLTSKIQKEENKLISAKQHLPNALWLMNFAYKNKYEENLFLEKAAQVMTGVVYRTLDTKRIGVTFELPMRDRLDNLYRNYGLGKIPGLEIQKIVINLMKKKEDI